MTEIEKMRKRRKKNVSYDAYSEVSQCKERPLTKAEIFEKLDALESEMLYLEGYLSFEEMKTYKRRRMTPQMDNCCQHCGTSLSDYVVWNDILIFEDGTFSIVRMPLSRDNIVEKFKRVRREYEETEGKTYKSYLLGEVKDKENLTKAIENCYCLAGEELILGTTCPCCGSKIDDKCTEKSHKKGA